jgi:hypothetical protein
MVSAAVGFVLCFAGANLQSYGWLLFFGVPFLVGFLSVLIYTWGQRRPLGKCLWVSIWPFPPIALALIFFGIEGLICIAMAAPLALIGLLGGYVAWLLQAHKAPSAIASCLLLALPPGILYGPHGPVQRTWETTTSIVVGAPPEVVWRHVTDFPDIGREPEAVFRAGVAYPLATEIDGRGIGAKRRCILSTGALAETVTIWNPPSLLRFRVDSTPAAMHELSIWPDVDPPHTHGFYRAQQGEFRLKELPGGKTLVTGTSWYSHGLEPASYWRIWTDYVVHRVHRRVLEHIKTLSEEEYYTFGRLRIPEFARQP